MNKDKEIYAKEQQIELLNFILSSLCSVELSTDGRQLLRKIKGRLNTDIERLRGQTIRVHS